MAAPAAAVQALDLGLGASVPATAPEVVLPPQLSPRAPPPPHPPLLLPDFSPAAPQGHAKPFFAAAGAPLAPAAPPPAQTRVRLLPYSAAAAAASAVPSRPPPAAAAPGQPLHEAPPRPRLPSSALSPTVVGAGNARGGPASHAADIASRSPDASSQTLLVQRLDALALAAYRRAPPANAGVASLELSAVSRPSSQSVTGASASASLSPAAVAAAAATSERGPLRSAESAVGTSELLDGLRDELRGELAKLLA